jgi:hypothetical protein
MNLRSVRDSGRVGVEENFPADLLRSPFAR